MKAPKCRVCGKEHWAGEPHDFRGVVQPEKVTPAKVVSPTVLTSTADYSLTLAEKVAMEKLKPKKQRWDREKWKENHREYMKKYRAKKKESQSNQQDIARGEK